MGTMYFARLSRARMHWDQCHHSNHKTLLSNTISPCQAIFDPSIAFNATRPSRCLPVYCRELAEASFILYFTFVLKVAAASRRWNKRLEAASTKCKLLFAHFEGCPSGKPMNRWSQRPVKPSKGKDDQDDGFHVHGPNTVVVLSPSKTFGDGDRPAWSWIYA